MTSVRAGRITVGAKIYAIVAMCFIGFGGVAVYQARQLGFALEQQKRFELQHLSQLALQIVRDEHDAAQRTGLKIEDAQRRAMERISNLRYGQDDYFWINDMQPRMLMHPVRKELDGRDLRDFKDPDGKRLFVAFVDVVRQSGSGFVDYQWPKPGADQPQPKISYVVGYQPWGWVIGTGVYVDDLRAQTWASARRGLGTGLAVVLATLAIGIFVTRRMSRAMRQVTDALNHLAAGRAEASISTTSRADEIGDIVRAYLKLKDSILLSMRLKQMVEGMPIGVMTADATRDWAIDYMNPAFKSILAPVERHLPVPIDQIVGQSIDIFKEPALRRAVLDDASRYPMSSKVKLGDRAFALDLSAIRDRDDRVTGAMVSWQDVTKMQEIATRFEEQVQAVVQTVGLASAQLQQEAKQMDGLAAQSDAQAGAGMSAARNANASVESVATGAHELLSSISEISRQVAQSNEIATQAVHDAKGATEIMRRLDEAAQKIGQVVDLIGTIAGQTNLLALNATIEAARAGEAGRGFAIVASEVKALATQTANATGEIVSQVQAIQQSAQQAVASIGSIGTVIERLSQNSCAIAAAIEEQSAATNEIARNAQQTSAGTQDAVGTISQVSDSTRRTGEASRRMLTSADSLMGQADTLSVEVQSFLAEVRAA
jgi:methyl-accepting chemotaxis protein